MRRVVPLGILSLGLFSLGPRDLLAQEPPLALDLVRFRAGGDHTLLEGYVHIPVQEVEFQPAEGGQVRCQLTLRLRLYDSAGTKLHEESWPKTVALSSQAYRSTTDAYLVESFAIPLPVGEYEVEVAVEDDLSGTIQTVEATATAESSPLVSDLLLAAQISPDTLEPAEGYNPERKHGLLITPNPSGRFAKSRRLAYFYYQVYRDEGETGTVERLARLSVIEPDGDTVLSLPPRRLQVTGEAGADAAAFPIAGLAEGEYVAHLALFDGAGESLLAEREEAFSVVAGSKLEAGDLSPRRATSSGPFVGLSEAEVDSIFDAFRYFRTKREESRYAELDLSGKRRFLWAFIKRRDLDPSTPESEFFEIFKQRFTHVNDQYGSRGGLLPGWKTDRGRIYLRYGEPDEIVYRPFVGGAEPYEIWQYTSRLGYRYAFYDRSRDSQYPLVYSTDPDEPTPVNWDRLLPREVVDEITGRLSAGMETFPRPMQERRQQ